ncbi:hypothetical protein [Xanthomonas theicola]|uniref:hypothetical protein n=1 Tax=Xanthomonas theicola TaxID=56464 RepID=UPI001472CFB7|nr:hypothetical protein [Xanthomonas theicola]
MYENRPVSPEPSLQDGRKPWSTPVVSFLAIEETANNATLGNDGAGPTTGS